jgi:thiol-disulfide isomerase/thioredoxin
MGRLSPLTPAWSCLLAGALCCGCEDAGDAAPAKSRVQAVLAEPGAATAAPQLDRVTPVSEPAAPARARPPLCDGQLERRPEAFAPKRVPSQISLEPGVSLPADPLAGTGARWTWVNFWAAWCVPCKQELPILLRWRAKLAQHLAITFISLDDDERQLREFLTKQPVDGLTSSYWLPDGATRQAWLQALDLTTEPELPLQLLIDPKGAIRCRVEGAIEAQDFAMLERIVRQ